METTLHFLKIQMAKYMLSGIVGVNLELGLPKLTC